MSLQNPHCPAQTIDDAMKKLSTLFLEKHLYESKAEHVEAVQFQLKLLQDKLAFVQNHWDKKIDNVKRKRDLDLEKIKSGSNQKISTYDSSIPKQLPPRYCKYSAELLNLMEMEKHLITSRRFVEADKLHHEIQLKQAKELRQQKASYAKSFEIGRVGVEMKNKRMYDAAVIKWDRRVKVVVDKAHFEIEALKAAISNIRHKLEAIKGEYIGENDPIVLENEVKPFPKTSRLNNRVVRQTVHQQADNIRRSNRRLDSRRWP